MTPDEMRRQICACGHPRSIHAGRDHNLDCTRVIDNQGHFCRCLKFMLPEKKKKSTCGNPVQK